MGRVHDKKEENKKYCSQCGARLYSIISRRTGLCSPCDKRIKHCSNCGKKTKYLLQPERLCDTCIKQLKPIKKPCPCT